MTLQPSVFPNAQPRRRTILLFCRAQALEFRRPEMQAMR